MRARWLGPERGTIALGVVLLVVGVLALLGRLLSVDVLGLGWPLFVVARRALGSAWQAAIVLAWLATQWRDGYSAAVVDLRAGRRPLTELER